MNDYEVVIVAGGPVGMAFGIELGMMNIRTAIIRQCLYDLLPINYVILIIEETTGSELNKMAQAFREKSIEFSIVLLSSHEVRKLYTKKYYLLRPDWHIAWCGDVIPNQLHEFINRLMPN